MKITESHLRSIIKEELNTLLNEAKFRLDLKDPEGLYGIPPRAVNLAFKNLFREESVHGDESTLRIELARFLSKAIHGDEAGEENFKIYYDFMYKDRVYETLKDFYYQEQRKNQQNNADAGAIRNDRFAKKHGF